jgi:predicted  nucleic acid-binding Zn-ribbon protein
VANPRVERRLRELESKLDRLLKEIEGLKGEKKDKANEKDDEEDDDQASLSPRFFGLARDTKFPMFGD